MKKRTFFKSVAACIVAIFGGLFGCAPQLQRLRITNRSQIFPGIQFRWHGPDGPSELFEFVRRCDSPFEYRGHTYQNDMGNYWWIRNPNGEEALCCLCGLDYDKDEFYGVT